MSIGENWTIICKISKKKLRRGGLVLTALQFKRSKLKLKRLRLSSLGLAVNETFLN